MAGSSKGGCPGQQSDLLNQRATECSRGLGEGQLVQVGDWERSAYVLKATEAEVQVCMSRCPVQAAAPQSAG